MLESGRKPLDKQGAQEHEMLLFLKFLKKENPSSDLANGNMNVLQNEHIFMIEVDMTALFSPWLVVVCSFYEASPEFLATKKSFVTDSFILPMVWKTKP